MPSPITQSADNQRFLHMRQAALWLGISRQRVHQLIQAGRIHAVRRDGRLLIADVELLRFARERGLPHDARSLSDMPLDSRPVNEQRDAEIVRLYTAGESVSAIARQIGVSSVTACRIVREAGVQPAPLEARRLKRQQVIEAVPPAIREEILRRYEAGEGCQSVARAIGWGYRHDFRVHAILRSHNITFRGKSAAMKVRWAQRRQQTPRFSKRELAAIVRRYQTGESCKSIAVSQGCSPITLRRLLLEQGVPLRDKVTAIRASWKRRQGEASPSAGATLETTPGSR